MKHVVLLLILLAGPALPQEIEGSHAVARGFSALPGNAAEDFPMVRRLLILTPAFLDQAEVKAGAVPISGDKSQVLVVFRLSERGSVIDARAAGGSERARRSTLVAVKMWRFRPTLLNGRPVQVMSGVVFDFSVRPVNVQAPRPMTAEQISPVLNADCSLALERGSLDAVLICEKESVAIDGNPAHSAMESLSAHDEMGLALLRSGDAGAALTEFARAIELAPKGLRPTDGEWAKLHWHRGAAEQQTGQRREAYRDFAIAEKSLSEAVAAVKAGSNGYRDVLQQLTKQHAAFLETEGNHAEAVAPSKKLDQ
jgi:tetratricopeptide (TPR) repeat protein